MNKIWLAVLVNLLGVVSPAVVYAQNKPLLLREPNASKAGQIRQEVTRSENVTRLQTKANAEIDRRLTALSKLTNKINEAKRLTDAQKSSILAQIQTTVTNLTNLKTKISTETDIAALRADVQSIVKNYQVFALVMPKTEIMAAANSILESADKLTEISVRLQSRGQDVTQMQAKIADAKAQANAALSTVNSLPVEMTPAHRTTLDTARTSLKTARQDLIEARQEAQKIVDALK